MKFLVKKVERSQVRGTLDVTLQYLDDSEVEFVVVVPVALALVLNLYEGKEWALDAAV